VIGSAILVALEAPIGDPIIGLAITLIILKITWDSWRIVSTRSAASERHQRSRA
jgi:divalent metal cation (Fe/Co/Zn/Cd) transporter